jgi:hypothetical protein
MEEVLDKEGHLNRPTSASDEVLLEYLGMENELSENIRGINVNAIRCSQKKFAC